MLAFFIALLALGALLLVSAFVFKEQRHQKRLREVMEIVQLHTARPMDQVENIARQLLLKEHTIPTEPGDWLDGEGDPWVLDVHGNWIDKNGHSRPQRFNIILAAAGPWRRPNIEEFL